MATRFYFNSITAAYPPTTGDKAASLPVGTDVGDFNQSLSMFTKDGASAVTYNVTTNAITTQQSFMMARHATPVLYAQTISANTWTIAFKMNESNAAANAFLCPVVYVWRPSSGTVVGTIRDSATTVGLEANNAVQTVTFSGSAVTCATGDVLVTEAWCIATQGSGKNYTVSWFSSASGAQVYLETPQNLSLYELKQTFLID